MDKTNITKNKFDALQKQIQLLQEELKEHILNVIKSVVQSHKRNKISEHIYIVMFSEMIGKPWNPEFYDWESAADVIIKFLQTKPVLEWKDYLIKHYNNSKSRYVIDFEKRIYYIGTSVVYKIPIDKYFVRQIIDNI